MNNQALIPLIATIAYIPLFVILLANRPWQRQERYFLLFLVPATLWSLSGFLFRSDFFMPHKLLIVQALICIVIWMVIQFHYVLRSFYEPQRLKIPLAYIFLVSTIALAWLGYIPRDIEITASGINVDYGPWILAIALALLFILTPKDIYSLLRRLRVSPDPLERNQIAYLSLATAMLGIFLLLSLTPHGGQYPLSHIGNFIVACILTYAAVTHRLLDIRVVLRRFVMYIISYGSAVAALALILLLAQLLFGFKPDLTTSAIVIGAGIPITFLLLHRVRDPLQRKIEQSFDGERYNYRRELSGFIAKIHDISTLEQFGRQFISLLSQSVGCQQAFLLLPEKYGDFTVRFAHPPAGDDSTAKLKFRQDSPVLTRLKQKNTVLSVTNVSILPEFQSLWQEEKEDIESAGIEMFVPLINRGELVAILTIGSKKDGKNYTIEDIDLLESVASRVAASMEKEYLHEQLREREQELTLINRLSNIMSSSMSLSEMFESFANELRGVVDIDWATICLLDGNELRFSALSSLVNSPWQEGERISLEGTACQQVSKEQRSLYEADLARHHRFWTGEHHLKHGIRSIIYLPLLIKDYSIGCLTLASRRCNAYSPKQIRLLEQVASQISTLTENAELYAKAAQRARIDELTELFNRRHFEERLKEELSRHSRYSGVFSLLLLDLDNFKLYNDTYGHPSGDAILKQVGTIIRNSIRSADQAFRYGGDEFVVILPQTPIADAYTVGERVRQRIAAEMATKGTTITCSVGLSTYPSDGVIYSELITTADTALYYAKRTGGNRIYDSSKILSQSMPDSGAYARGSSLSAVYALAAAVDAKDSYTYDHSKKVNSYAVALAEAYGLSPDEVSRISCAALLHDIGKIGIPDRILSKKGKLTPEEWESVKSHPRLGANIIGNVPSLVPCKASILYHHEKWDGTGYPESLVGEQIPLEARILAIADAFAAMISGRPYRSAYSHEEALQQLQQASGTQFDPRLVEVFVSLIKAGVTEEVRVSHEQS